MDKSENDKIPDCTLTTASFVLTKYNGKSRNLEDCLNSMKALLKVKCFLVIYTDEILFPLIKKLRVDELGLEKYTKFHVINVETLDVFKYLEIVKGNREKYYPTRDERTCAESHLICCSKFELVLKTIEENPFQTSKFGWIDGNVGPNFSKIATNYEEEMLPKILDRCDPSKFYLQILNVCNKNFAYPSNWREYYSQYRWVVCGCLFVTGKEVGKEILKDLNETFIKHTFAGYGHGEEMFYLEILEKHYDSIERSYGDYQHILNNFAGGPTVGLDYIFWMIANNYASLEYYRECKECCEKVLHQFENSKIEMNEGLYQKFLFLKNLCLLIQYKNASKNLAIHLLQLANKNPEINYMYRQRQKFYEEQFKFILSE